jgi:hypothetical protein
MTTNETINEASWLIEQYQGVSTDDRDYMMYCVGRLENRVADPIDVLCKHLVHHYIPRVPSTIGHKGELYFVHVEE